MQLSGKIKLALVILLLVIVSVFYFWPANKNSDALWHIVSEQCVPNQQQHEHPTPCAQVDDNAGFVVLKDREGPLQYLLMPSHKITGIESPLLLDEATPNFFELAWQARHFMSETYGSPIADNDIAVAINSKYGRSQNQLHIHISCLRPDIKQQLQTLANQVSAQWQALPVSLIGHDYLARRISATELHQQGAFRLLASGVADASSEMENYGLAMVALPGGDFMLLATKRHLLGFSNASAEELQDHQCQVLKTAAAS